MERYFSTTSMQIPIVRPTVTIENGFDNVRGRHGRILGVGMDFGGDG